MWKILNEPFTLSIIALAWGSIVTNYITSKWNRYNKTMELRISNFESIFVVYHRYIRIVKANQLDEFDYSEIHSELVAQTKVTAALFRNPEIYDSWNDVHQRLSNIFCKRAKEESYEYKNELGIVFEQAKKVMSLMINELK